MAEACRFGSSFTESRALPSHDESFCIFNVFCVFISLVTILADLTTDLTVFAEYCKNGYIYWAITTFLFIVTPIILINIFSLRWIVLDKKFKSRHWITHCCLVGLLERYTVFLQEALTCQNMEPIRNQKILSQRNDLSLLHFLYTFTGTVPQIILQSYAIIILDENYHTKAFALTASIASVVWACATYIYSITSFDNENFQWNSVCLKVVWHFGMLIARISGIVLFTIIFGVWTLVPLGLHWAAMTFWIVTQKTTFCPNRLEETFYNVVMGFVYCFCYINLREGHTRYRLLMFYTLMVTQNFGSLFLYVLIADKDQQKSFWSILATIFIVIGTIIGMCGMILYYRWFHEKGPIMWKNVEGDIELNNKSTHPKNNKNSTGLTHVRSFKSQKDSDLQKNERNDNVEQAQQCNLMADKNFLLDQIARSGTPMFSSAPITNNSLEASSIEFYTVENTPNTVISSKDNSTSYGVSKFPTKKKSVCPSVLASKIASLENIESSIDEITASNINLHKRRGICSSDELRNDLNNLDIDTCNSNIEEFNKCHKTYHSSETSQDTDSLNKKTSSDSIDMDLDLSFSDINSSDINTFNENIVQKLCLSALKNIKVGNQDADIENIQRIALDILKEMYTKKEKIKDSTDLLHSKQRDVDTPTEMMSVHDYENICAVNIAREAWGLRSWNGYSDIENWVHDGSVVRDRRRDTLTSGSSEISSCISQELRNSIMSAPPFPKKMHTYSNVLVKFDRNAHPDYVNTVVCQTDETFLAKPCVADVKDANHLEPILEELDDLGDIDSPNKKRLNSESSLVATIDEIRKATVTNSPRNVYHRRDLWESPQFSGKEKMESNLKRALWKEPFKFNSNNIMETLPVKGNNLDVTNRPKIAVHKKEINLVRTSSDMDIGIPERVITFNKNVKSRQKSTNLQSSSIKKVNNSAEDLSNKNIDLLWKLVSEYSVPTSSAEDLSSSQINSSLQSLILKDTRTFNQPINSKNSNIKKGTRSKPRRKFSILREKFEPRISRNSDEEILYQYSENAPQMDSNVKNMLEKCPNKPELSEKCFHLNDDLENAEQSNSDILSKNIKEKRTLFMKQVLSPPKFNTKLRHKV
ncbi:hypothetical protein JYU34_014345 [Plutella xylostella]|uniref:XK-related protein n=1 Tax=Plutella xylostella TaxID=51655 RepID=A0ABQ7Q8G8_PLUXY|nr:hypothetical protein JYU34_014345 [Plutella xylostella]